MLKNQIDKWSRSHNKCLHCNRNDRRHKAKGYCVSCYSNKTFREPKKFKHYKTSTGFRYKDATRAQSESCDICGKECKTSLDHNHQTNKFRGWLCMRCNVSLGQVKDNIEILQKMISYLITNS